jgi:anti-sigma factor RsiW
MCPDKALLSVWYDGEVEEPWKGEIETHIAECDTCRALIEEFKETSRFLMHDEILVPRFKKKEIYRRVMHQHRRDSILPLWQKSLPLSAAAAIGVVLLGLSLIIPSLSDSIVGSGLSSLASRKYEDLSDQEELVTIMLPPEQHLSYYGDSQLLKKTSYEKVSP